ncbi:MAG: hypothetical protein WDN03_07570 [Rhizomicrobium sp.]
MRHGPQVEIDRAKGVGALACEVRKFKPRSFSKSCKVWPVDDPVQRIFLGLHLGGPSKPGRAFLFAELGKGERHVKSKRRVKEENQGREHILVRFIRGAIAFTVPIIDQCHEPRIGFGNDEGAGIGVCFEHVVRARNRSLGTDACPTAHRAHSTTRRSAAAPRESAPR